MTKHDLKLKVGEFDDVWSDLQRCVLVPNKLKIKCGDSLILREFIVSIGTFTGREIVCVVMHTIRDDEGLKDSFDCISIFAATKRIVND
jgi:hypothetical protein